MPLALFLGSIGFVFNKVGVSDANVFNDARADKTFTVGTGFTTQAFPSAGIPKLSAMLFIQMEFLELLLLILIHKIAL